MYGINNPCVSSKGCNDINCQQCCPHDEYDHGICLDCGYERDMGEMIDEAVDAMDSCED